MNCYLLSRWGTDKCQNCDKPSKVRYCSLKCRKDYWNRNDYRIFKKSYHWDKKLEIGNPKDKIYIGRSLGGGRSACALIDELRILDGPVSDIEIPGDEYSF